MARPDILITITLPVAVFNTLPRKCYNCFVLFTYKALSCEQQNCTNIYRHISGVLLSLLRAVNKFFFNNKKLQKSGYSKAEKTLNGVVMLRPLVLEF